MAASSMAGWKPYTTANVHVCGGLQTSRNCPGWSCTTERRVTAASCRSISQIRPRGRLLRKHAQDLLHGLDLGHARVRTPHAHQGSKRPMRLRYWVVSWSGDAATCDLSSLVWRG